MYSRMASVFNSFPLAFVLMVTIAIGPVRAGEIGILPPDLDYKKICVTTEVVDRDTFNWEGKTPATSDLSLQRLIDLARLYFEGNGETTPDYNRAREIVEYLVTTKGRFADQALSVKYEMLLSGKGYPQNTNMAKTVLDQLIQNGNSKAYSQYGSLYALERDYTKAAEYFRKAFALGYQRAVIPLAYLYHDKKIPASQQELEDITEQAQDVTMKALMEGDCHALTQFAFLYGRMSDLPKAEHYSALWAEKAALQNRSLPKMFLAGIIQRGYALPYDEARIIQLWKEAAALGSDRAMFLLGEHAFLTYKNDEDLKTAAAWLEKAAERRNVKAMEMLVSLYEGQYPVLKNDEKRREWLEKAVEFMAAKDTTIMTLAGLYEESNDVVPEKIFALHSLAAQNKNNEAYVKMGNAYRYGIGVKAAPAQALRYYRLAASSGDTEAMKSLKYGYECSIGTEANPEQAKFWSDQIEYYNSTSTIRNGYLFLRSTGEDLKLAEQVEKDLTLMAVTRKDGEAMILLGLYHAKKGNAEKSQKWINTALQKDAQNRDNYPAHTLLGSLYLEGVYVPSAPLEGLRLLNIAGRNGSADAYAIRGEWYLNNNMIKSAKDYLTLAVARGNYSSYMKLYELALLQKDKPLAVSYLEKAAARNNIEAMFALAENYANVSDDTKADVKTEAAGPPDLSRSRRWFEMAVKNYPCNISDIISVVSVYLNGKYGMPKDERQAGLWFDRIRDIKAENYDAAIKVANSVLTSGLSKDPARRDKAIMILKTAAEKGNPKAAYILSKLYLNETFPGYDPELALQWITRGADMGDIASMMELANMNMSGYGVPASLDNAILWLKKAANAGSSDAAARLRSIKVSSQ